MIGSRTRAKVVKNKVAPPFKTAEFDIMYGEGISKEGELVDLGVATDVVQKSGAWFSYGDIRLGQGRDNAKIYFRDNPEVAAEVDAKIRAKLAETSAKAQHKLSPAKAGPVLADTDEVPAGKTVKDDAKPKVNIDIAVDD